MNSILFDLLLYCGTVAVVVFGICTFVGIVAMVKSIRESHDDRNKSRSKEVAE